MKKRKRDSAPVLQRPNAPTRSVHEIRNTPQAIFLLTHLRMLTPLLSILIIGIYGCGGLVLQGTVKNQNGDGISGIKVAVNATEGNDKYDATT